MGRVGRRTALFDMRVNKDVSVLVGCGLGGTSLINAGVMLEPPVPADVVARRDLPKDPGDNLAADDPDTLDEAIAQQSFERYRDALATLRVRDRELIVARIESQWTVEEIRDHFSFRTANAVRLALARALRRLRAVLDGQL